MSTLPLVAKISPVDDTMFPLKSLSSVQIAHASVNTSHTTNSTIADQLNTIVGAQFDQPSIIVHVFVPISISLRAAVASGPQ